MMEEKPAEANTGRHGSKCGFVLPQACQGQSRAGNGSALLLGPLSSYSASQGKEGQTSPSDGEVPCLKRLSDWSMKAKGVLQRCGQQHT